MSDPVIALVMLGLFICFIFLGFPIAFTLMAMGVGFGYYAYFRPAQDFFDNRVFYLLTQNTFSIMNNDTLVAVPLFLFMGYVIERANILDKLFLSLQVSLRRVPGSMAVAALLTCAMFATATGIVGAVVTLMGLLAFPAMLRHGYDIRLSAGAITAGGCLGILIPPSVLLIVYGATAGVSVVQLYAGAFFPGLMLAGLYIAYVIILAKLKPHLAPPLSAAERLVPLPPHNQALSDAIGRNALAALLSALKGRANLHVSAATILRQLAIVLLPAAVWFGAMGLVYKSVTKPPEQVDVSGLQEMGSGAALEEEADEGEKEQAEGVSEPPSEEEEGAEGVKEPPSDSPLPRAGEGQGEREPAVQPSPPTPLPLAGEGSTPPESLPAPLSYWIVLAAGTAAVLFFYWIFDFARLEIFKMLLGSFFPLAVLILSVLGSIVFGLATPSEAAAVGSLGGILLAAAYRRLNLGVLKESVFLTAKTSAMVCWLFVGSSIFSAAFALLGGQALVEQWVLSLDMTPLQFMILAQFIIFILGWPLEWTEIIVIFMPIFIPLLSYFSIDPLFFGLLVALNLQTAFLSPPVAMAAFYLKGVAPPHVSLNQIFLGMMPYMVIQVLAIFILYMFPAIGLWLPSLVYKG